MTNPTEGITMTDSKKAPTTNPTAEAVKWFVVYQEMERLIESLIEEATERYRAERGPLAGRPEDILEPIVRELVAGHPSADHLNAYLIAQSLHPVWVTVEANGNKPCEVTPIGGTR